MNSLPLEEVANIYSGNSINAKIKKEKYTDKNFSTPYVATKDLSKNGDFEYNNGITIPDTELDNFKIAPKGSTLICMEGGSAGKKIGLLKQDVCFVNKLGALVPNEKINNRYLYYSLQTPEFQAKFKSSLTGIIGGVSLSKLKKLQIPVPSLQEQEKIVERLDKAFSYIDLHLKNIKHKDFEIDKLFASILYETFSEKEVMLGNFIELNYGKDLDKKQRGDKFKIPLYGSNGIMDFTSKSLHDEESVIIGRKGSVGELQFVEGPFWVIDVGFYVTLTNKDHSMKYYFYLLKSLNLQNLATGVKPGLNRNKVYDILVPKHSCTQQNKIVDKLDKLFLLENEMQNISMKKIASNGSLKQSILNKEFSYE